MSTASGANRTRHVDGSFNYMAEASTSSLYRNGKVFTRRDRDGSDSGRGGIDIEARVCAVTNARDLAGGDRRTLEANGFELAAARLPDPALDFLDHEAVVRTYYPHCADVVRAASGARLVAAFDHNVRSARGKQSQQRIDGGQQVQGPAHLVHGDYTLTSAPERLRQLALPPGGNDTLRRILADDASLLDADDVEQTLANGRFAIINVWRNIAHEPVATHPLALCDAVTVHPDDLVVFEIHYADRVGENYFAKARDDHRWYFYPGLERSEALLIKQWDSAGGLAASRGASGDAAAGDDPCTFSFHSAFEDPLTPDDAPDRWSIEVRCVALY